MNRTTNLSEGPVLLTFLRYASLSILALISASMATVIDGIFIGRFVGADALAAVNLVFPAIQLTIGLGIMLGTGGVTYAAIALGAKRAQEANNCFSTTLTLMAGLAVLVALGGVALASPLARALARGSSLAPLIEAYFRPMIVFVGFQALGITLSFFAQREGRPGLATGVLLTGSLMNILLDYVFVVVLDFGIAGAAYATGIAYTVPFVLLGFHFLRRKAGFKLIVPQLRKAPIGRMLFNGLSEFAGSSSASIVALIINQVILVRLGAPGVAAFGIAAYVMQIGMLLYYGCADGTAPAVALNHGAGNADRVRAFVKAGVAASLVLGVICFVSLAFFGGSLGELFAPGNVEVAKLAKRILSFVSFTFLVGGANIVLSSAFTAVDRPVPSILVALSRSLVMVLLGLLVLPAVFGNDGLWFVYPFADWATLGLSVWLAWRIFGKKGAKKRGWIMGRPEPGDVRR